MTAKSPQWTERPAQLNLYPRYSTTNLREEIVMIKFSIIIIIMKWEKPRQTDLIWSGHCCLSTLLLHLSSTCDDHHLRRFCWPTTLTQSRRRQRPEQAEPNQSEQFNLAHINDYPRVGPTTLCMAACTRDEHLSLRASRLGPSRIITTKPSGQEWMTVSKSKKNVKS